MKILIAVLMASTMLLAFFNETRYINGEYNDNLKVIWMYNDADNQGGGLQTKFGQALNNTLKRLQNDFVNIRSSQKKDYSSILSIIEDPTIYTHKEKLFDADMLELYDTDVDDQLVVAFKIEQDKENNYRLFGIKLFKDGDNSIVTTYEVNKESNEISQAILEEMAYFFVKSSIDDYESVKRSGSEPIITYADETEQSLVIELFKPQEVKKFTTDVASLDFELASSLKLVSSPILNQKTAEEYCETLGMMLLNKNFVQDTLSSEYYYELLFEKYSFKDGWIVYKRTNPTDIEDRDFRCIDAKDTIVKISIQEYELNEIGLRYRLNNNEVYHESKIVAVDIQSEFSEDNNLSIYTAIIDEDGILTVHENAKMVLEEETGIRNVNSMKFSADKKTITITNAENSIVLNIKDGFLGVDYSTPTKVNNVSTDGYYIISEYKPTAENPISVITDSNNELSINGVITKLEYWPLGLAVAKNRIIVGSSGKLYIYFIDDDGYLLPEKTIEHNDFSGDVVKVLFFKDEKYFVVATTKSELVFYKKDEPKAIKTISNFGYSINDIAISSNQQHLIAANGDQTVYIFDLDVILNATISDKGDQ